MVNPKSSRKNVYFTGRTLDQLGERDSLSGRIAMIVDRYAEMCRRTRIERKFSDAERNAILDATISWLVDPAAAVFGGVAMEIEDAIPDGLAEKWGVDVGALLEKLRNLTPGDEVALVEWIETQRSGTEPVE